jgi:Zn-dependent protease with chaperone function
VTAALILLGYAAVAAWSGPVLLAPLTSGGTSVRPGLAAWLSAMASAVLSAALGLAFMIQVAAGNWPALTQVLCREVAGKMCTPQVYQSALYPAAVAIAAAAVTLAALVALWRYGRRTQRSVTRTRMHARTALLAGRALPGTGAVVLDDPRPAAYCVAGRPAAIVVTSGALAVLDKPQLAAVLAHERAHLAGRHHLLATVTRGLAAAFPGVPLFTRGTEQVSRLAELAADDVAARSAGRWPLVTALLAIATGTVVPGIVLPGTVVPGTAPVPRGSALAAAALAVPARVERLLRPPARGTAAMSGLTLGLVSGILILLPVLLAALARA